MNINTCRLGTKNGMTCIFRIVRLDDQGQPVSYDCSIKGKDYYNLYPETNADGDYNYQPVSNSPFRIGDQAIIWESTSFHSNGKDYTIVDENGRSKTINPSSELHPSYTVSEHNYPTKSKLESKDIGEIFGDENPTLVCPTWSEYKFSGRSRVEECNRGIYGRFDKKANIVIHSCLRSHIGVPGFINYTNRKEATNKIFFLSQKSDSEICEYAHSLFKEPITSARMAEAMIFSKNGNFVNLYAIMENNFVSPAVRRKFMNEVSWESLATIYKGKANLFNFYLLYRSLDKIQWSTSHTNENGKVTTKVSKLHKDVLRVYKENLLNWILNYPTLKRIIPNQGKGIRSGESGYPTDKRYWWVVLLMKIARKQNILSASALIPKHIVNMFKEKNIPTVEVFGEKRSYKDLPEDLKRDMAEAEFHHMDGKNPHLIIQNLYPGMINIKSELIRLGLNINQLGILGWGQFCLILKLGQKWSMLEIVNAFEHFLPSWMDNSPIIFYEWLNRVVKAPIESTFTSSQDELNKITDKLEIEPIVAMPSQPLLIGALEENIGLGDLSDERVFAKNILDNSIDWESWLSWDDWNTIKVPIQNWWEVTSHQKKPRETQGETFFNTLAMIPGFFRKDKESIENLLSKETLAEAGEFSSIASMGGIIDGDIESPEFTNDDNPDDEIADILDNGEEEELWPGEE